MDEVRKQIASNLKKFRKERELSVDDVGKAVGKSGKTVSAWEVGRGQPNADEMVELCRYFVVDISDFYGKPKEDTNFSASMGSRCFSAFPALHDLPNIERALILD